MVLKIFCSQSLDTVKGIVAINNGKSFVSVSTDNSIKVTDIDPDQTRLCVLDAHEGITPNKLPNIRWNVEYVCESR